MYKKTTSDRGKLAALLQAFLLPIRAILNYFRQRPRSTYIMMVVLMMGSAIAAFTILRAGPRSNGIPVSTLGSSIGNGLGQILDAGQALKEVLELNRQIGRILDKDSLDAQDTIKVRTALDRLEYLQKNNINPKTPIR